MCTSPKAQFSAFPLLSLLELPPGAKPSHFHGPSGDVRALKSTGLASACGRFHLDALVELMIQMNLIKCPPPLSPNRVPHFCQDACHSTHTEESCLTPLPSPSKLASKSELAVTLFLYPFPLLVPPVMPPRDFPDELEKNRDGPLSLRLERRAPQAPPGS